MAGTTGSYVDAPIGSTERRHSIGAVSMCCVALALGGCASVGPNFRRPESPLAESWIARGDPRITTQAPDSLWWRSFNDPALDRLASLPHVLLGEAEPLARGSEDLLADEVHAGDEFRDGMLHLETGVDFEKIVMPALVQQEFDRSGVGVSRRFHRPPGRLAHLRPEGCV